MTMPPSVPARAVLVRIETPCARYSTTYMIALPVTSATATPGSPVRRAGSMNRTITSPLIPSPTRASRPREPGHQCHDHDERQGVTTPRSRRGRCPGMSSPAGSPSPPGIRMQLHGVALAEVGRSERALQRHVDELAFGGTCRDRARGA